MMIVLGQYGVVLVSWATAAAGLGLGMSCIMRMRMVGLLGSETQVETETLENLNAPLGGLELRTLGVNIHANH